MNDLLTNRLTINNLTYQNDYTEIFKIHMEEMKYIIIAFFIIMTITYTLEYHNTKYAKTLLESEDAMELYKETLVNACVSVIVVCYLSFSRGRHWKAVMLTLFSLFILTFLTDTIFEASGLNRYLKTSDTENGIGRYAKLDENNCDDDVIDESVTMQYTKEYPFIKSFMYSILIFAGVYFVIKFINILKCAYYGYIDEKGCTHIQNEVFFNGGVTPQVGFGLELIIIAISTFISAWLKQLFCDKHVNHTNMMMLLVGCITYIINHIVLQYVGMYGVADKCEK